jgi:hypothetical protein
VEEIRVTLDHLKALVRVCETFDDPELRQLRDDAKRVLVPKPDGKSGRPKIESDKKVLDYMADQIIGHLAKNPYSAATIAVSEKLASGASDDSTVKRLCRKFGADKDRLLAAALERISERSRKSKPVNMRVVVENFLASERKKPTPYESIPTFHQDMIAMAEARDREMKRLIAVLDTQRTIQDAQASRLARLFHKI